MEPKPRSSTGNRIRDPALTATGGPPPPTRAGCAAIPRPCDRACRYRLDSPTASCELDVADQASDGDAPTHEQLADMLGVSRVRIVQIEREALAKLHTFGVASYLGIDDELETMPTAEEAPLRHAGGRQRRARQPAPDDERASILTALEQAGGHKATAAQLLGIGKVTLWRKMKALGIECAPSTVSRSPSPDRIAEALDQAGGHKADAARQLGVSTLALTRRMRKLGIG